MTDYISRADAIEAVLTYFIPRSHTGERGEHEEDFVRTIFNALPSADAEKKKAELKENGDWDCPDVDCDECDHHRSVEWCSLAIPNHEKEIDETYKMVNEAFFEGFDAAEKRYRFLIETVDEFDKKLADAVQGWIPLLHDGLGTNFPHDRDGEWVIVTDGNNISVERIKKDAYDHFFPNGRWFELDEVIAWQPLPKPYKGGDDE